MSVEPGVALPVVREDAPPEGVDPYVIAGWDSRAHAPGLSAGTLRSARAVSEALFSTESGPPPAARLDWLEADLGDFFVAQGLAPFKFTGPLHRRRPGRMPNALYIGITPGCGGLRCDRT